jgi:hypothetical protein
MAKITGNEPAFPFWKWNEAGYGDAVVMRDRDGNQTINEYNSGLTIRQYFAIKAMNGLLSDSSMQLNEVSFIAIQQADALIRELNETTNPNEI